MSEFSNSKDEFQSTDQRLFICQFELETQLQAIRIDNNYVRLRSKLWDILLHLVKRKNLLVEREEMIELFWHGNRLTGEQGATHTICHLRKIFKQFGIDAKIITIPKRGYVLQEKHTSASSSPLVRALEISNQSSQKNFDE